jgi:hypothetical protein
MVMMINKMVHKEVEAVQSIVMRKIIKYSYGTVDG